MRATVDVKIAVAVGALAVARAAGAGTIVEVGPFAGTFSETWEGFDNYQDNPNTNEPSPASILDGEATITVALMSIYEPGVAEFLLGTSGAAQVADGVKGMGIGFEDFDTVALIEFETPVTDFGAFWGAATGSIFGDPAAIAITFFDLDAAPIDTVTIEYSHSAGGDGNLDWHGWHSQTPVGSITYSGNFVVIDGMQVIPVPGPGGLLPATLAGLCIRSTACGRGRRRRRPCPTRIPAGRRW
ncbi:MAG: hypothetical protein ACYSU7_02675 [Planctomycetota bacterium]|jgi:hypothetical protein